MCLSYFGGKNKVGEFIYPFFPKNIKTYVEPFAGAMWLYFNLKHDFSECENIIYNELNKYMVNLITCSKDYDKLLKRFEYHLNDPNGLLYTQFKPDSEEWKNFYKELYYSYNSTNRKTKDFLDEPKFNIPDFDAAVLYAFLQNSTFNGCFPNSSSGQASTSKGKLKLQAFINKLNHEGYQNKFKNITQFENMDFEDLIKKYDSENTYFYLDPPYNSEKDIRADWYGVKDNDKFGGIGHERLANLLQKTKAKWSLSYYYFEDLEKWFPKDKYFWESKSFMRTSATGSKATKEGTEAKGEELLIMNYDPSQIDCKIPIDKPKKVTKVKIKVTKEEIQDLSSISKEKKDSGLYEASGLKEIMKKEPEKPKTVSDDDFWN